jgi:tetratricopeptide (TPR) repeat protein
MALPLVIYLVFIPVLSSQAHYIDDDQYFIKNSLVKNPGIDSGFIFFKEILSPSTVQGYYQPIAMLSLMLDYARGARPDNYYYLHQTNLLIHITNTLLLVCLLLHLFKNPWLAYLGGLLFGLHPICVESIAWISDRKTLLSALFCLCSLLSYLSFIKHKKRTYYLLALLSYCFAMLSKPTCLLLPLAMISLDYALNPPFNRKKVIGIIPLFGACLLFGCIAYLSQNKTAGIATNPLVPAFQVPFVFFHNILFYLYKTVWPASLPCFYPFPTEFLSSWTNCIGVAVLFLCIAGVIIYSKQFTMKLLAGFLFYIITLLPCIQFLRFSEIGASDKYLYFPLIGILIACLGTAELLLSKLSSSSKRIPLFLTVIVFCIIVSEAFLVRKTLSYWKDTEGLYTYLLDIEPGVALLHNNLGSELKNQGRIEQAISHFRKGLECNSRDYLLWYNLGSSYSFLKQYAPAEEYLTTAIKLNPKNAEAYSNLGSVYENQNNYNKAIVFYEQALSVNPRLFEARMNLAQLLVKTKDYNRSLEQCNILIKSDINNPNITLLLGMIYFETNQLTLALDHFNKVLVMQPDNLSALFYRGRIWQNQKQPLLAEKDFLNVLQKDPNHLEACMLLSDTYLSVNEPEKASQCLLKCLDKGNRDIGLLCRLSVIHMTFLKNPTQAVTFAQMACQQSNFSHPGVMDVLASSYAASGDFKKAVEIEEMAIAIARKNNQHELVQKFSKKLDSLKNYLNMP